MAERKIAFTIIFLLFAAPIFAQIDHIGIAIGKSDSIVTSYLDSLNRLKSNPLYKIKRDVSASGDLTIEVSYSLVDEPYYGCFSMMFLFFRSRGREICTRQLLLGSSENAQRNLNYVKDNFSQVSSNTWERPLFDGAPYKIVATFEKKDGENPTFVLTYDLIQKN